MSTEPKSLQAAIVYFSNADNCVSYLVERRWPDGVVKCPTCGSEGVRYVPTRRVWQCKTRHPKCQFSVKVGTIFEDSPIGLDKWLTAMWMIANCRNGVSSHEIARTLEITQKSAWFMLHRIRLAMTEVDGTKLGGDAPVEIDETFIGGKVKNMHAAKIPRQCGLQGGAGKAVVLGMLERGGKVRAKVVKDRKKHSIQPPINAHVEAGAHIITDEFTTYPYIAKDAYVHEVINHVEGYVRDHIHTNGIENFWSLLKRGLTGTYISVEPFHLDRYVDEQVFRFNNRVGKDDAARFDVAVRQIVGRRLTYAELTGKTPEQARPF